MKDFKQLKRLLKVDTSTMPLMKVALLGDTATQLLSIAIKATAIERGYSIDLFEADFNQVERQLLDTSSELYKSNPDIIIIFQSTHKLAELHSMMDQQQQISIAEERAAFIENICNSQHLADKKIICINYPEIDDTVFGSYANRVAQSLTWQVRRLNCRLMELSSIYPQLYICDLGAIQNKIGRDNMFAPNIYTSTEMILTVDVLPIVAARIIDIISALRGQIKKCIILDLDNTLWGGVIGDDGIEGIELGHGLGIGKAFTEFQMWIRKLRQRGIIICVASKNDENVAKQPFMNHPDMVLTLDDIAVFMANWETKVDNIRNIQIILNIGFDSMVFIDDNPFERNIVRENIPGITVPEMPDDPAEYLEFLYGLNLFETASYSNADNDRTRQYQEEAKRVKMKTTFTNEDDFLRSLNMTSIVSGFNKFNIPRVAQLTQRSNQFNLRTVRYTEDEITRLANDSKVVNLAFTLKDRFGDNGLIAVVIMLPMDDEALFVDTWIMSCRVLKRGMENFTLNMMVKKTMELGYKRIVGEYLPTRKNSMVANHYEQLGFKKIPQDETNRYYLDVDDYKPSQNCWINESYS